MPPFSTHQALPPTILTIFGATGDLAADYLLPALLNMDRHGMLPKDFRLVAVGRRSFTAESYLRFIVKKSSVLRRLPAKTFRHFLSHLLYFKGDFDDPASFAPLGKLLEDQELPRHRCYNRLYYFATSPQYFAHMARILKEHNLLMSCAAHDRKIRILVEKPFGFNESSAKALNRLLLKYFSEDQIYRIDHYMGKETVQNLMVVRFANRLFEPLWNRDFIDHVEISVFEKDTARTRAEFYEQTGALKDFVQNHMLQMLSLIAMDEPKDLQVEMIRDEKLKVLKALRPFTAASVRTDLVRGQYEGFAGDVGRKSATETFVALKAFVDVPRWSGVPFYLRTGKALSKKETQISVHFKELDRCLFRGCAANVLTFRIQPDESVFLQINNKVPGFGVDLHQGILEFGYKRAFKRQLPTAYERLLLDFMQGDQRLFIRSDEIEAAWKFIDSISSRQKGIAAVPYKRGSAGPAESEAFIRRDGREWWTK